MLSIAITTPQPCRSRALDAGRDRVPAAGRWLLLVVALALILPGLGLRDPWPPDEPRFALMGHDMAAGTSSWVVPSFRGSLYAQKPPLFMWLQAGAQTITGSLRLGFLLPSLLAALGVVWLVHDLAGRLWGRRAATAAGWSLLLCVQFVLQARSAQIDMVLCGFTTLAFYGLCRHLLLGPAPGWFLVAWAAAGFGIITKGVGFLPLVAIVPWLVVRHRARRDAPLPPTGWWPWVVGPLCLLAAMALWLVPMLWVTGTGDDPALRAYRDEILFGQTWGRYAKPTHHVHWFGYFLVQSIPALWLPLSLVLPWVVPQWWRRLRKGDAALAVLLGWLALALLFFSLSKGKRGVYLLPLVPVFCLALGPVLPVLWRRRRWRRAAWWLGAGISAVVLLATAAAFIPPLATRYAAGTADLAFDVRLPVALAGAAGLAVCLAWRARPFRALAACTLIAWTTAGLVFWPALDAERSGAAFMAAVARHLPPDGQLGMLAANTKEQFILEADRPVTLFGHSDHHLEARLPVVRRWLAADPRRRLLADTWMGLALFPGWPSTPLGEAHRRDWVLIRCPQPPPPTPE